MRRFLCATLISLCAGSVNAQMLQAIVAGSSSVPSHTIQFTALAGGTVGGSPLAGSGTYSGTAPSSISTATWTGCGGGSSTVAGFSAGAGTWSATFTVPPSSGSGCTIAIADNLGDTATSPGVTISAGGTITFTSLTNNQAGTQAALVGTYTGAAPSGLGSQSWGVGTGCSGTPAVTSFVATGGNITANIATLATGNIGCTFTATGTGSNTDGPKTVTSVVFGSGIALVAHAHIPGSTVGGTSGALRTTGSTFLSKVVCNFSGAVVPTTSDSLFNSWTPGSIGTSGEAWARIYYVANPTVGTAQTFSTTGTALASASIIMTFSGVATSPFDNQATNGGSSTSPGVGAFTPSNPNSLILAGMSAGLNTTSATIDSGLLMPEAFIPYSASVNEGCGMAYIVQGAAASINPVWTIVSASWGAVAAWFHP